jgi:two-component system, NtrC family, nitrogen regulation sensor histidine kinase NtrY
MKNFRLNIFIRVALIVGLAIAIALVLSQRPSLFIPAALALVLAGATVNLIIYIEKSNRDLTHFLLSIRQGAFTETFPSGKRGKKFEELSGALNDVVAEFARVNLEKELHHQFLEALNENISVAILTFDDAGKLMTINPAAKKLINLPFFSRLEDFKKVNPILLEKIQSIKPEQKIVIPLQINTVQQQVGIQLKEIVLQQKLIRIFLLQNLNSELEAKEIDAWQQLMRVLTHEIMNSVTPIVSLSQAIRTILSTPDGDPKSLAELERDNLEDVYSGINTIESRSRGLVRFVSAYKEYARPVELKIEDVDLTETIKNIVSLVTPDIEQRAIRIIVDAPDHVHAKLDRTLIDQVIINILKNAIEAVKHDGTGQITLTLNKTVNDCIQLTIADNGEGMDTDTLNNIFIPFFTTKPGGSGIGLSFSRQIIRQHGGTLQVSSEAGVGTVFTIEL